MSADERVVIPLQEALDGTTAAGPVSILSGFLETLRHLRPDIEGDLLQWTVVETILRTVQADGCSLDLEAEGEERLAVRHGNRVERRHVVANHVLQPRMIGNQVLRDGTLRLLSAIEADEDAAFPPYVRQLGFRSAIILPVLGRTGFLGVLAVYFREEGRPALVPFEILILLNHVASVAIENANLYREIQRSYFSTVASLTSAIDAVSPATHGHSKRVTQYALILGESLALEDEALSALKFGALLHDIGKLGISPEILEKRAPLSPQEYEIVKEHPVIGERIIAPVEFLQTARPIIRHHHERWDGRGYPDRLRGEEIPLGARIVAIADFYDAMLEDRPYRRALDPVKVAEEVRRGRGSLFDPDLCERFLQATGIAR
jgi:hypothetical protein